MISAGCCCDGHLLAVDRTADFDAAASSIAVAGASG